MTREEILNQIKKISLAEYTKIETWIHDVQHVKRVVKEGVRLCKAEQVKSKDAFLVELACWLHDVGRVDEPLGLTFSESDHAEKSYQVSKQLLKPYEKFIGRESMYNLLQAIREHSQPRLRHPHNLITRILQDADRGSNFDERGIFTMLGYFSLYKGKPIESVKEAKLVLPALTTMLRTSGKIPIALEKLNYFKDWYYGCFQQMGTGVKIDPLHTLSAKRLYQSKIKVIEDYIHHLESLC